MLPPNPRIQTYEEFWPFYLEQHSKRPTKLWHATGTVIGIALAVWLAAKGRWVLLPAALIPGYGASWLAHFFIEKNKPATFTYPWWSFLSDFRMLFWLLIGKL